jgi:hypothetical protein
MTYAGKVGLSGDLDIKVIRPTINRAPLGWRLRNMLRFDYLWPLFWIKVFVPMARRLRIPLMFGYGELRVRVYNHKTGEWVDYGVVSRRVITDAAVTYIRDQWNGGAQNIANWNYHGIGTGTGAEATTDTALGTESTTALNPDSTRATGTKTTPASNQFRSVGTLTVDSDVAVTEHGLFTQAATGGGTLFDRSKFAAINLVGANPDSIQCTYTGTLASGG